MVTAKHSAGSTKARLHFIHDKQRPVLVAKLSGCFQKVAIGWTNTAFALNRLDNDRCNRVCFNVDFEGCFQAINGILNRNPMMGNRERRMKNTPACRESFSSKNTI